jgi:hypothetical protein
VVYYLYRVCLWILLLNRLFLTNPKVVKSSRLLMSMRAPKLTKVTHKQRLSHEELLLPRTMKIMLRWRQMDRQRLSRLNPPLLQRCECLRVDSVSKRRCFVKPK